MPTRRQYLTAAATPGGLAVLTTTASADAGALPSHITADTEGIERYQPMFHDVLASLDPMIGIYGWHATSDHHDVEAHYYWIKYTHQKSQFNWLTWGQDAHLSDHEPVIVFTKDGEVVEVLYSGYHHLVSQIDTGITLSAGATDEKTHANLRIDPNYHHYYNSSQTDGVLLSEQSGVEFGSWLDKRDPWYDRGIYSRSSQEAVDDPFALYDGERDSWWSDGQPDQFLARLWVAWGLDDADSADPVRAEGWF